MQNDVNYISADPDSGERVRAATFVRPSLPWCFNSAAPPLDPSCAGRKQARWQPAH